MNKSYEIIQFEEVARTLVRVVCQNTLGVALGEKDGAEFHIVHTASAKVRLNQAGRAFRRLLQGYELKGPYVFCGPGGERLTHSMVRRWYPRPVSALASPSGSAGTTCGTASRPIS
ncbi:MAG TPA: DUF932 domain-containing protein [Myxococcaceae bacterium]